MKFASAFLLQLQNVYESSVLRIDRHKTLVGSIFSLLKKFKSSTCYTAMGSMVISAFLTNSLLRQLPFII
jgi:uncharacterized membrane protein